MIATLSVLVVVAIAIAVMVFGHVDGGYALLGWGNWTVETSIVVLVLCAVVAAALVYGLLHFGSATVHLPGRVREGVLRRRAERARQSFEAGLMHLFQGQWKAAETELVRHASDRGAPWLNYLAAARSAQRLAAPDRRDHYLGLAAEYASRGDLHVAIIAARAELQQEQGDYAALAESAGALRRAHPDSASALELQADALVGQSRWEELMKLLGEPAAAKLAPARREKLRVRAVCAGIGAAVTAGRLDELKQVWEADPDAARDSALRLAYVDALVRLGADDEAQAIITHALDQDWDAELAAVYARLQGTEAMTRLAAAEVWLQRYGDHPELLAVAGRACLEARLWGKAGSYLEALLRQHPSPQACWDLARLAESTQRPADAAQYYRQGLTLAVNAVSATPAQAPAQDG